VEKFKFKFQHSYKFQDSHYFWTERPYTFKWGLQSDAFYQTIDFIYFTPNMFDVLSVRDPLTSQQRADMVDKAGIPNLWHPSDHLPAVAVFKYK